MAGYSDNRELNIEVKYLRKVLSGVNENITMPESLRGQALLSKLPEEAPAPSRNSFSGWKSSKLFAWQSGVSYAVAFALIVAIFYGVRLASPQIIDGYVNFEMKSAAQSAGEAINDADSAGDMQVFAAPPANKDGAGTGAIQPFIMADALPAPEAASTADNTVHDEVAGIGGAGESVILGGFGKYSFAYRNNDAADPDKSGYLSTFDIVDNSTGLLAAQIDIPDMRDIFSVFVEDDALVIIGGGPDGVISRTYGGFDGLTLAETAVVLQQGRFEAARIFDGVLRTVSFHGGDEELACESVQLDHSEEAGACIITALRVKNGESTQLAFIGAGDNISLHDHYAYIYYSGQKPDSSRMERFVAQISLGGTDITLSQIS